MSENKLGLYVSKTWYLVVGLTMQDGEHNHVLSHGGAAEMVDGFKLLGTHTISILTCTLHTDAAIKKAHQRIYFLGDWDLKCPRGFPWTSTDGLWQYSDGMHLSLTWLLLCSWPLEFSECWAQPNPATACYFLPIHLLLVLMPRLITSNIFPMTHILSSPRYSFLLSVTFSFWMLYLLFSNQMEPVLNMRNFGQ